MRILYCWIRFYKQRNYIRGCSAERNIDSSHLLLIQKGNALIVNYQQQTCVYY